MAALSRIRTQAINGGKVKTDGFDIQADYDIGLVHGRPRPPFGGMTYVHKYKVAATTVEGVVVALAFEGVGKLNYQDPDLSNPAGLQRLRRVQLRHPHRAGVTNYIDSAVDQRTTPTLPNGRRDGQRRCR